jgi:hypothetical protein
MRPEQGRGLQTGDGQSLDDSAGDFVSSCRCDDASATAQLGFFQGEQEIAAAEGREIETVGFIQQNLVRPGFPLLGRPHCTATQDDNFRFRVDARLVGNQHARVLTEKVERCRFPMLSIGLRVFERRQEDRERWDQILVLHPSKDTRFWTRFFQSNSVQLEFRTMVQRGSVSDGHLGGVEG